MLKCYFEIRAFSDCTCMPIWLCICMFVWKVVARGRALSSKHIDCLFACYVPAILISLLCSVCFCWFVCIRHFNKYFLALCKQGISNFLSVAFLSEPPFSPIVFDMDLLIVTLNNGFWWHVSMSLRVCLHIYVCLAGGNKGSRSRVGFYDEIQWQFEVSNHWTREWEKDGKGERERGGKREIGGKREREREEGETRDHKNEVKKDKGRSEKGRERQLMASSYSKLREDMKASPQSIYH